MTQISRALESVTITKAESVVISKSAEFVTITRAECPDIPASALLDSVEIVKAGADVMITRSSADMAIIGTEPPRGVPAGGDAHQILHKTSATDYATEWAHEWSIIAHNVEYTGNLTVIASGEVDEVIWRNQTIYRYRSFAVNDNDYRVIDAFYAAFDGTNLSGEMARRNF